MWINELAVFRGVPFAAPPVGALRFAPPLPHPDWSGIRDATQFGPASPQLESRLSNVMGGMNLPQSEDCLYLNIWTPTLQKKACPVLVWIHGGGYITGSSSLPFYAGTALAFQGNIVVVTVNYRLGALGYLYVPDMSDSGTGANRGLLDQIAALQWIHHNITVFGGDADNITIAGHSAGGGSVAALLLHPHTRTYFHRAILESPALLAPNKPAQAMQVTQSFLHILGINSHDIDNLRSVPLVRILEAQQSILAQPMRSDEANLHFNYVPDGDVILGDFFETLLSYPAKDIDVLLGTTCDEARAFIMQDQELLNASRWDIIQRLQTWLGDRAEEIYDYYAFQHLGQTPTAILAAIRTYYGFRKPVLQFSKILVQQGNAVYIYQFDWAPKSDTIFGACHGIEIPFVFNNLSDWIDASIFPTMLEGVQIEEFTKLSQMINQSWISFIRSGNPNNRFIPQWPLYNDPPRRIMHFNRSVSITAE